MARQLGISRSAVSQWAPDQPIPEVHELKIRYVLHPGQVEKGEEASKQAVA